MSIIQPCVVLTALYSYCRLRAVTSAMVRLFFHVLPHFVNQPTESEYLQSLLHSAFLRRSCEHRCNIKICTIKMYVRCPSYIQENAFPLRYNGSANTSAQQAAAVAVSASGFKGNKNTEEHKAAPPTGWVHSTERNRTFHAFNFYEFISIVCGCLIYFIVSNLSYLFYGTQINQQYVYC